MPILGGQEPGFISDRLPPWNPSPGIYIRPDARVIPQDVPRAPPSSFPDLKPKVPIYITERDIADMDRREDNIERMEKIVAAQQGVEQAAREQAAQVRMQLCCPVSC